MIKRLTRFIHCVILLRPTMLNKIECLENKEKYERILYAIPHHFKGSVKYQKIAS